MVLMLTSNLSASSPAVSKRLDRNSVSIDMSLESWDMATKIVNRKAIHYLVVLIDELHYRMQGYAVAFGIHKLGDETKLANVGFWHYYFAAIGFYFIKCII